MTDILKMRNIGISAHIDSGKTTLTERMLFYCKKIHAIHEVRGKDGVGATMDSMELEKERGITIASAATNVSWKEYSINIIDTPGHVDFTIEVERALRVLDGAILVLCAVGGVQSQSITVDRQLKRYQVPRIAFINKCDRTGSDPYKVTGHLREKLGLNAIMLQLPIGLEEKFQGIVDLVKMQAIYFDGSAGEILRYADIPAEMQAKAAQKREELLDAISMFDDELAESFLDGKETEAQIAAAIRKGVLSLKLTPVCLGSAYKNKGVQPLMDAAVSYLPSPLDVTNEALDLDNEEKPVTLPSDRNLPVVALAFKLEDGVYGQLTYIRIYQGTLKKGSELFNTRSKKKIKVGRLIRMHSDAMEDIDKAYCGDIVALFGVDCVSGDTFTENMLNYAMTSMFVPKTVISLALKPQDKKSSDNMAKALNRFTKEDPTFQVHVDRDSRETIIRGMGELHLEVYVERMRREYKIALDTGRPQVAYREAITREVAFEYTHKKQTGGSGQFAKIQGVLRPNKEEDFTFISNISGGSIPKEYIPSCEKGFRKALAKGKLLGFPVLGVEVEINDGLYHPVDSSDMAFQLAAQAAFRENYHKAGPIIMEPIMLVAVESPTEYQGNIFSSINQRRGIIISSTENGATSTIEAEVPLSEMFGYSTILRSMSQGKAEYSMELASYKKVPKSIQEDLIKAMNQKKK